MRLKKLTIISLIVLCVAFLCACDENVSTNNEIVEETVEVNGIEAPISNWDCEGKNYEEVVEIFKSAGFTNVVPISQEIESEGSLREDGEVVTVWAGDKDVFDKGELLESDVKIGIGYVVLINSTINGYNVEPISGTMYASSKVNVRSLPDKASEKVGSLSENQSIEVTGKVENGWYRVLYNDTEAYVHGNYLAGEKKEVFAESTSTKEMPVVQDNDSSVIVETPVEAPVVVETPVVEVPVVETPDTSGGGSSGGGAGVIVPGYEDTQGNLVWVPTNGGKKYHSKSSCSNMDNPMQVTVEHAEANGYTPCKRCY